MGQKRAEKLRRRKARQLKGTRRRDEPRQEWAVSPRNIALIDKGIQSVLTEPLVPLETVLDECNDSEREHASNASTGLSPLVITAQTSSKLLDTRATTFRSSRKTGGICA